VPSDDPYVYSPFAADSIPRVSTGRIPAWSATDLAVYIDKVLAYESGIPTWKTTALHVVEDRDYDGNDGALARRHADSLATFFGPREEWNFQRSDLYGTDAGPDENAPIINAWNAGLGYAMFYGTTGSRYLFGFLFGGGQCASPYAADYDSIRVTGKTPVVFGLTCGCAYARGMTGQPSFCGSLSQYLLFAPGRGAVSVTGPSRAIHEIPAYAIAKGWYQAVFGSSQPGYYREPGVALQTVKQSLIPTLPASRTEIMEMTVLGDPALQFYVGGVPTVGVETDGPPPSTFTVRQLGYGGAGIGFAADLPRAGEYAFVLYDVQGRVVGKQSITAARPERGHRATIEPAVRSAGIYFLRGQGEGLVSTSKIVVLH